MDSATWTLFLVVLMHASSALKQTCPPSDRYLTAPSGTEINDGTVCGKLYAKSACCSSETVQKIQNGAEGFFNKGIFVLKKVSKECETALMQITCLFECSPDLGNLENFTTPLKNVPICGSSCTRLYSQCKYEETCTDDWSKLYDDPSFDCLNYDNEQYPRVLVWQKFNSSEELFCSKVRGDGVTRTATPEEGCFHVEQGAWVKESPHGNHTVLAVIGVIIGAIVVCLALFYIVTYTMKKRRLARGI